MKKNIFFIVTLSATLLSCESFLDLAPENQINTQSFYRNQNDFQAALYGAYASLQGIHDISFLYMSEMTTDNAEIQLSNPTAQELEFDQINFTPTNGYAGSCWSSFYTLIARTNTILGRIENASFDETAKKSIQGQCLFLRAYAYFNLVRLFGDVTLVTIEFTSPNQIVAYDKSRKPVADVYAQIITDLTQAESLLPQHVPDNRGMASVGAVKTLLAKVYLTRKDYLNAATQLEEVMALKNANNSTAYTLSDNYGELFSEGNENKTESIFEIEYLSGNLGEGNSYASNFYPLVQGMAVFKGNLLAGGRCVPTQSLMDAYEPGDKRKDVSVGDQLPLTNGTFVTSTYCRKFIDYSITILTDGGVNFTVYRLADIYLMYAEVLNELDRAGAETYLNHVRERAGLVPVAKTDKDDFREIIARERRVELAYEGHRWYDLVRTGKLQSVMKEHFESQGLNFSVENHELLLPVPQSERDKDPNLSQNPGY
ncbi:MAG: RagB/SusD family nutrient uptake outer membrane protein [Tannerella sp.]|jgi:hypothetical protein|nr:RagB/SusD family nutrient uptake outer membrane protein [Tannerella sp.]